MNHEELFTICELAGILKKSEWYIRAMRRAGFSMPGGTATITEARDWLRANPDFRSSIAMRKKSPRIKKI